jgi:hypothetical protein
MGAACRGEAEDHEPQLLRVRALLLGVKASTMSVLAPGASTRWPHVTDRCSVSSYLRRLGWRAVVHLTGLCFPARKH